MGRSCENNQRFLLSKKIKNINNTIRKRWKYCVIKMLKTSQEEEFCLVTYSVYIYFQLVVMYAFYWIISFLLFQNIRLFL